VQEKGGGRGNAAEYWGKILPFALKKKAPDRGQEEEGKKARSERLQGRRGAGK